MMIQQVFYSEKVDYKMEADIETVQHSLTMEACRKTIQQLRIMIYESLILKKMKSFSGFFL